MTTKETIFIILAIIAAGCIIAIGVYAGLTQENNTMSNDTINVTNNANNTTDDNITKEDNQQSNSNSNYHSGSNDNSHYVYYEGEKIDTSKPGQFEGTTQEEVDNYHPEL